MMFYKFIKILKFLSNIKIAAAKTISLMFHIYIHMYMALSVYYSQLVDNPRYMQGAE
jgi:hypothetical protein